MILLLVYAAATVVMALTGVTGPEHRMVAAPIFLLGLIGTWRRFVRWRSTGGSV
jgi:hypothetical protein